MLRHPHDVQRPVQGSGGRIQGTRQRLAAVVLALAAACGGGSSDAVGVSTGARTERPVELDLRTTEGVFVSIGDMRGRIVVLFLFASFDTVCQAAEQPLSRFTRHHPEVDVVAIAVQPNADQFAAAWEGALNPPFLVTYDADEHITEGTTDLGAIEAVPTYIVLDARGYERAREVGFMSQNALEQMIAAAVPSPGRRSE